MVPWVGLQFVIVVFPDHTHFFISHYSIIMPFDPFEISYTVVFEIIMENGAFALLEQMLHFL